MTPARDVGGDFFDLVPLADGRVALGVGDVCGKGVPAALFTDITRTLISISLVRTAICRGDPKSERISCEQQRRRVVCHAVTPHMIRARQASALTRTENSQWRRTVRVCWNGPDCLALSRLNIARIYKGSSRTEGVR